MMSRRGPGRGPKACPDGKCPVADPKATVKKKARGDGPKKPARPKKSAEKKDAEKKDAKEKRDSEEEKDSKEKPETEE